MTVPGGKPGSRRSHFTHQTGHLSMLPQVALQVLAHQAVQELVQT
jgi:hypothetical protein